MPAVETDMLVGYLRTLSIYRSWPNYLLARTQELGIDHDATVVAFERISGGSR